MADKHDAKHYEQLGRMLESIYDTGYIDHARAYKFSFLKGLISGLGGVIGATIMVAILLWVLSLFNNVPVIGRFVQSVNHSLQSGNK